MTLDVEAFDLVVDRARALAGRPRRTVLGIAGTPGAGKTTLALAVVAALADLGEGVVTHVPMDGFHLADVELARLGRSGRKGAPDTFDVDGYAALLRRLRTDGLAQTVYAPAFDRTVEQPVAGSIPVLPACRLVVSEGNYLLLDAPRWVAARAELAEVWWCDVDPDERRRRLVARHVLFGKSEAAARSWILATDEPNIRLVEVAAGEADVRVLPGAVPEPDRTVPEPDRTVPDPGGG